MSPLLPPLPTTVLLRAPECRRAGKPTEWVLRVDGGREPGAAANSQGLFIIKQLVLLQAWHCNRAISVSARLSLVTRVQEPNHVYHQR